MFPPKKESAPFNYRKEHCSSIISGTFGSRNPNLPRCLCIFSSALASSVFPAAVIKLPHWNIWRALPVYVLCADSMPCKITIWRIIHRKRNLLFCFHLFSQPSRRPAADPAQTPSPPPPWLDMCAAHEPPRWGLGHEKAMLWLESKRQPELLRDHLPHSLLSCVAGLKVVSWSKHQFTHLKSVFSRQQTGKKRAESNRSVLPCMVLRRSSNYTTFPWASATAWGKNCVDEAALM